MEQKNSLLLDVANGQQVPRPPVWLMRQAGRILPEYRALRAQLSGFKELVETPELAAEVSLQPVDILGVDAAIIFSDILVIPEAMGLTYEMVEKKGPHFPQTIQTAADIDKLRSGEEAAAELNYVYEALRLTKKQLAGRVPLIGFAGAPWTIFAYMIEGQGSKTFSKARRFLYTEPLLANALLDKITQTTIAYLRQKVIHGADLIQVFDSWAGILPPPLYRSFSLPYLRMITEALRPQVPVTLFAKDAWWALEELAQIPCQTIGLDWMHPPGTARRRVGDQIALQGNLDPCLLYAKPEQVYRETTAMIDQFAGRHIANLGHGVYPDTPLAGVRAFIQAVKDYRY
ncbi:MAG: uroporphyrinogen decarboxylase [Bacteroidetes bacterium]|nr:MAG: uroporphyrinogen decarboxylase [Bacteroidota bacterium]